MTAAKKTATPRATTAAPGADLLSLPTERGASGGNGLARITSLHPYTLIMYGKNFFQSISFPTHPEFSDLPWQKSTKKGN